MRLRVHVEVGATHRISGLITVGLEVDQGDSQSTVGFVSDGLDNAGEAFAVVDFLC
jgi:hypothetical protein